MVGKIMSKLDDRINANFSGLVVRKDLVKAVRGNAAVPNYVLEYLLGQYCATDDENSISTGIETVKDILRKHLVNRKEAPLIRSNIKERNGANYKVIDKIQVDLNDKDDVYEATFSNLGIKKVLVDSATVKAYPRLLVSGVWCIVDLQYEHSLEKKSCPWIMSGLKPIQLSKFDFAEFVEARKKFSTEEWIDLLLQSLGFNPELFDRRNKLLQLVRLIPYCERNYNLIELGPKGTGKSHVYAEFSPHGFLISGSEVTMAKLFVNNSNGKIGLIGFWDAIAFDEFAGRDKKPNKVLVDTLKNYMANKTFSRGVETIGAEASLVFVGNTDSRLEEMLKHSDLFIALPKGFYDSAFLDRMHFYIPGWEIDIIRGEMFSEGYGFIVDYYSEVLRHLRNFDYANIFADKFELSPEISTRDRDGITKTFSGLMKILFPGKEAEDKEIQELLHFAIEGRKRVKDQLARIDQTFKVIDFYYLKGDKKISVTTQEEEAYPNYYYRTQALDIATEEDQSAAAADAVVEAAVDAAVEVRKKSKDKGKAGSPEPEKQAKQSETSPEPENKAVAKPKAKDDEPKLDHIVIEEGQKGVSFEKLFGRHLKGASCIVITDPYMKVLHQVRSLMELLELWLSLNKDLSGLQAKLITKRDEVKEDQQLDFFERIKEAMAREKVEFIYEFDESGAIHARHIVTNHGWKILLDRGLDMFQYFSFSDYLSMENHNQLYRSCKKFEVTFLRNESS